MDAEDTTIFEEMTKQCQNYCKQIQSHPVFSKSDFNVIGVSQGNIVAKYIIEACDLGEHKVHNYLSISGPH